MKKLIIFLCFLILTSCASKPKIYVGGSYGDSKLSDDEFVVSFHGDVFSNPQHVQNMLYVRCSELALTNGYPYFVVLENNWQKKTVTGNMGIIKWSESHTYTNKIKFLLQPHDKLQNFDAKAIYTARIKEINQED